MAQVHFGMQQTIPIVGGIQLRQQDLGLLDVSLCLRHKSLATLGEVVYVVVSNTLLFRVPRLQPFCVLSSHGM